MLLFKLQLIKFSAKKEKFYNIESKVHLMAIFITMKRETVQFDDMCSERRTHIIKLYHKMYSRLKISIWLAAYSTFSSEIGEEVAFYKNS